MSRYFDVLTLPAPPRSPGPFLLLLLLLRLSLSLCIWVEFHDTVDLIPHRSIYLCGVGIGDVRWIVGLRR